MHKNIPIVVGITILFMGTCITPTVAIYNTIKPISSGNTLYVGGSGEGNYSSIQDAIDDATTGDIVFVYEKKYYENLYVNKSITIIGQNRENTIVDGSHASTHSIRLVTDNINVCDFTFFNDGGPNGELVFLIKSDNCYISNCSIHSSQHSALELNSASYNTIFNCSIYTTSEFGGGDAIRLLSSFNTFINCEIYNNRRFGILLSSSYNSFLNCNVYGNGEAGVRIFANNNFFSGCNFYDNDIGFKIDESRNHIILNCMIYDNNEGIRLWQYYPKNVTIRNCDIFNNKKHGIKIIEDTVETTIDNCRIYCNGKGITVGDDSLYTSITNTTIYDNNFGIYLDDTTKNTITNNSFLNDSIYVNANKNTIHNNTVNGKPLVYLEDESDKVLDVAAGQIILVNCDNITIQNQEISMADVSIELWNTNNCLISGNTITSNSRYGILLLKSNLNTITDNYISNNEDGIRLDSSRNNNITGNNINSNNVNGIYLKSSTINNIISNNLSINGYGIYLTESSSNIIYHNNFIDNIQNAYDNYHNTWDDDTYGNYWSDYRVRYPNASKIWLKGIWDTPYEIPPINDKDNFPLIKQWPKTRTRTITSTQITFHPLFLWFLEHFSLLEKLHVLTRLI